MNAENVLDLNQRFHDWMGNYHQELEKDINHLVKKHAIGKTEDLARSFENLTEENRLLQIGVVGRVKAGKSSLLNALIFDGHNILPRAATPMTAALTTLTHANTFGAKVQFYSTKDIENFQISDTRYVARLAVERENAADAYRKRRNRSGQMDEDDQFWGYVEKTALRAVQAESTLAAAHDQWRRIQDSEISVADLEVLGQLQAKDSHSLASQLRDYVGADGRYMPFTKSVDIFLPLESLRNVRIIDTPGMNDPVQSREERTTQLLKDCDVVFIVSPAGQFLSEQDIEVMSRITHKEGVRELVLIASQVDNQLYGSDTRQPTLQASLEMITQTLSTHMVGTLQRLKMRNPEIGNTFDSLIQQGAGKVLHTSGMCHSLSVRFDQQDGWDSSERKAWENLQTHYQDFFTPDNAARCHANLDLLANTAALRGVLEKVRGQKDRIIELRRAELIRAKASALEEFRADLLKFTKAKYQEVKNADVDVLKMERRKLDSLRVVTTHKIDGVLAASVVKFQKDLNDELSGQLKAAYDKTEEKFKKNTSEKTETRTRVRDSGAAKLAHWLWGGGKEAFTHTENKVFLAPVQSGLKEFAEGLAGTLKILCEAKKKQFHHELVIAITHAVRLPLDDAVEAARIILSVKSLVSNIKIPPFELDSSMLAKPAGTGGHLLGAEAESFMDEATNSLETLKGNAEKQIRQFIDDVCEKLYEIPIGNEFFEDMQARIKELEEQVDNAMQTLDRLQRMAKDLEAV